MSKLVTNDNLKAYHAELAEHIKLLQRDTAYVLDDIVNYDGITLKCTTAGTTNTTKPNISSLSVGSTYTDGTCVWTRIDTDKRGIDYWASSTTYSLNDQVVNDNKIYKCSTAHTSTSTFDATKWTEISAGGDGGISIWQANTEYAVNDVVIDSNLIWQCATAHTSSTTFDKSKWICISGGEISNGYEIVPLWEGSFSFSNGTSGSTPSQSQMMELNDSINNYEYFYVEAVDNERNNICSSIIRVNSFTHSYRVGFFATNGYFISSAISFYDTHHAYIGYSDSSGYSLNTCYITSIQGIRKAPTIVSSGMKYETLWEGEAGSLSGAGSTTINLSEPVNKYQKIGLSLSSHSNSNKYRRYYVEVDVNEYIDLIINGTSGDSISYAWPQNNAYYFELTYGGTNQQLAIDYNHNIITKIIGISEGVVVPTGVQAARVTLYTGNSIPSANSNIQLVDDYRSYDKLELIIGTSIDGRYGFSSEIVDVNKLLDTANTSNRCIVTSFNNANIELWYNLDTTKIIVTSNVVLYEIVGIKYIQPDSYSTEERLIGTWIDGKPLYRKVFENVSNNFDTGLSSSNVSIKKFYGEFKTSSSVWMIPNHEDRLVILNSGVIEYSPSYPMEWLVIEYTKN